MDLISKEALLNDLCEDREEGTFKFTAKQAEAADKVIQCVYERIKAQPIIPAVPLDKLCEWLGKVAIFRCCECTSNCCDGEECSSSNHFDKEIKKWMENECGDE